MKSLKEMWTNASTAKATEVSTTSKKARKGFVGALAAVLALVAATAPTFAANDALNNIATTIKGTFEDIYSAVMLVSTVIAISLIAVCLVLRMVSKNPRTAEEATAWIKRIAITWLLLMLLSVFLNYGLNLVTNSGANTTTPW